MGKQQKYQWLHYFKNVFGYFIVILFFQAYTHVPIVSLNIIKKLQQFFTLKYFFIYKI
jgi:hypothetical protein